jgi:hypothetical protein
MDRSELQSLQLAALSSDAQIALMQDYGFDEVEGQTAPKPVSSLHNAHLSRVRDKLRKDYDDVIEFGTNAELRLLLSQLDQVQ